MAVKERSALMEKRMNESPGRTRRWWVLLAGFTLLLIGNIFKPHPPDAPSVALLVFVELVIDLGIGLFVAAAVSLMFDLWYQKQMVSDPLDEIVDKIQDTSRVIGDLGQEVVEFNPLLRSARVNAIHALYRRSSPTEVIDWRNRVKERMISAEQYILVMGRSLDDLLPENPRYANDGILPTLRELKEIPILFLFADVFDEESEYRKEAGERAGDLAASLYGRTRRSIKQLLDLAVDVDYRIAISIRLVKTGPPFALVMTERSAIVEPYLPYLEGGSGIIYEVRSAPLSASASLHHSHRLSFGKLWSNSRHLDEAIEAFLERKSIQDPDAAERYRKYQAIAKELRDKERAVVTRSQLF